MAIVGSGIAGLATAHALAADAQVTLFEAGTYFGGHTHTVDVTLGGVTHGVDTGFLVFNHRTYPNLVRLFEQLGVQTAPSEMSFSVQAHADGLEWSGNSLTSVFAQRRNLLRPRFLAMLADIVRFNRLTTAIAERGDEAALSQPIAEFLREHRFKRAFRDWYFLPMIGCIWSCPTDQMLRFPIGTMIRFCHNHGLIALKDRPQWHTVRGGAKHYVQKMLTRVADKRLGTPVRQVRAWPPVAPGTPDSGAAGVEVSTDHGSERFDDVVLACHSDQALALLATPSREQRGVLGAIRYHPNRAMLHTDPAVLPSRRVAWAAWNYARAASAGREQAAVCLHYWINRLQPLPWQQPVIVSLNPDPAHEPDPRHVLGEWDYSHPVFDQAAVRAQALLPSIQGSEHLWFAGAWARYGFHEDGLMSSMAVVQGLRERWAAQGTALDAA